MRKQLIRKIARFLIQPIPKILVIAFFALYLPAHLAWKPECWADILNNDARINSLIIMLVLFICNLVLNNKFFHHLRNLNFRYILPVYLLLSGVLFGALFVSREAYSLKFMGPSWVIMLLAFLLYGLVEKYSCRRRVAYVPCGNLENVPVIKKVTWIKLEKPSLENVESFDLIAADLRADLSDEWQKFLAEATLKQIPVYHSSRLLEILTGRVKMDHLYENNLGSLLPSKTYQIIKRILETLLIIASSPIVLPVMLITALLIKLESPGSVFFLQQRMGQRGVPFTIYKFRSMYTDTSNDKTTTANDSRVTRIGKFIRKSRIDELPQFINVLKGEMSLIGPRAEFVGFAETYEKEIPFYSYRHIVKPGISGWAQVVQGYNFGTDETKVKLEYDFYYIKNFSFSMDLLIFFKTIMTMLTGFGAR